MTKAQAGNQAMLTEMKEAMIAILSKHGIAAHDMSSFVSYGDDDSKISFSFSEKSKDENFYKHLESLKFGNVIAKNVTVDMFKAVRVQTPRMVLRVVGLMPGRPYKVLFVNDNNKSYTMHLGTFLDQYAQHLKPQR